MEKIRLAIVGVGNCASSLIQGIEYYRSQEGTEKLGLMHYDLGGYQPGDLQVVAAFDVDRRKVGRPLAEAIFSRPNCTKVIDSQIADSQVIVSMGHVLDGVSEHMRAYPEDQTFLVSSDRPCDVEKNLRESGAEILLNYLPVGSEEATRFYATCCLNTGVSLINCMPVFIASGKEWADRFAERGIPVVGDDVKAQLGATILHRMLTQLFVERGVKIDRTYQLNTGGNTDFLNMLNQERLRSKKISKTEAVQSILDSPLDSMNIHIGPSDYVPWQKDNKVCFLRIEGRGFAGVPLNLELRLSVEDSPNSAGVTIDAVRCCKLARERKIGGPLTSVSAYAMKHPPQQFPDPVARQRMEEFIRGERER
ncbi:MAG: inositol-3-phosphate synthase [Deltaproteobacteria bacterium]|nr:inositol-3-phosphate synthase [Deltaproteobacteria bacterium]